jgi:hypothetical protein
MLEMAKVAVGMKMGRAMEKSLSTNLLCVLLRKWVLNLTNLACPMITMKINPQRKRKFSNRSNAALTRQNKKQKYGGN